MTGHDDLPEYSAPKLHVCIGPPYICCVCAWIRSFGWFVWTLFYIYIIRLYLSRYGLWRYTVVFSSLFFDERTTGLACFAEGCPRQRPLGEFLDGEGVFAEGPLSGTRQSLCRGPPPWPSAKKFSGFFQKKPLPRAIARALGKEIVFFWIFF